MEQLWTQVKELYLHDQINWNVALIITLFVGAAFLSRVKADTGMLGISPKKRGKMMRRARRSYVRGLAVDGFVHFIEEQVYGGGYTREEARELYRDLKKCFPVTDLFPNPVLLKEAIQKRRASGIHEPVKLPGKAASQPSTPASLVKEVKAKKTFSRTVPART